MLLKAAATFVDCSDLQAAAGGLPTMGEWREELDSQTTSGCEVWEEYGRSCKWLTGLETFLGESSGDEGTTTGQYFGDGGVGEGSAYHGRFFKWTRHQELRCSTNSCSASWRRWRLFS